MADFNQIDKARKELGLKEEASFADIKLAYRELVLKYHPDRSQEKENIDKKMQQINHARDVLMNYCLEYKFSFKEKDVKKQSLNEEELQHLRKFYDGWWGDLDL